MGVKRTGWIFMVWILTLASADAEEKKGFARYYPESPEKELSELPQAPSHPPGLIKKEVKEYSHCERFFVYEGKQYECDSNLGRDAERFRPIMKDVPQAIAELDRYQKNLQNVQVSGYLMTSAFVLALGGFLMSGGQPFNPASGAITLGGGFFMTGLTLGVGAAVHGFTLVNSNDQHIQNAVDFYNQVHPDRRIELKFSTSLGSKLIH